MNYTDQIIRQHSIVQNIATNKNNSQKVYVYSDLNVRDPFVSDSTEVLLYDTKAIIQGVWRLLNTEEGEIPNFRQYGLSVKRFCQYPLTTETVDGIYNYVKERIEVFETPPGVRRIRHYLHDLLRKNEVKWNCSKITNVGGSSKYLLIVF